MVTSILLYLDPGSGSILAQIIIGGLLSLIMFFKNFKSIVMNFFRKKK